ncbi:hypothetical protein [Flavobacterium sp. XGLA_31]|uniref:hypothetical protein n=1 Tax=Flavobacterium sp. XGLA_31 TaxID=3447666 RepID=UPI003F2B0A1A
MKKFTPILYLLLFISCVQKTRKVTVEYRLEANDFKDIKSVGVRGSDKPLSWDKDFLMQPALNGKIYRAFVTYNTGYKFTEVKFVVNDSFELSNSENRRIIFSEIDTTVYNAKYNVPK